MYARPEVEGEPIELGVSGKLWRDSLLMYDRTTQSLWSQVSGKAVAGEMEGAVLQEIPSVMTTWAIWQQLYPTTEVLVKPKLRGSTYADYHGNKRRIGVRGTKNEDDRLGGKELVFGVTHPAGHTAVSFNLLSRQPIVNGVAGEQPIVVFLRPGTFGATVFERTVDAGEGERTLSFYLGQSPSGPVVRDRETDSIWAWKNGECLEGELAGLKLAPAVGRTVYWGIWSQFHEDTGVLEADAAEPAG